MQDVTNKIPLALARLVAMKPYQPTPIAAFIDQFGVIGNRTGSDTPDHGFIDGGDSLQRESMMAIASALLPHLSKNSQHVHQLKKFKIGPGLYVRHPDKTKWYSNLNTTTGDQIRPLVIALGFLDQYKPVLEIAVKLIMRLGFYWNTRDTGATRTDKAKMPGWSGPEHWGLFIRALCPYSLPLYPLLLISDLLGLLATLHTVFIYSREPKHCDQLNRLLCLLQGVLTMPTPLSFLSHYIFRKYRPAYDIYVDSEWGRTFVRNDKKNPGEYVIECYFWNRDIDPPLETSKLRVLMHKYFERP